MGLCPRPFGYGVNMFDRIRKFFDYNDPKTRARMLRFFWIVSLFMLVLGYLLIIYFIFLKP